jgi:hypothetical protein
VVRVLLPFLPQFLHQFLLLLHNFLPFLFLLPFQLPFQPLLKTTYLSKER